MLESRSATPAPRNEVTWCLKPPKVTTFAALASGTGIATSRGRLRTAADASTPKPPEWNGNPCYAFGKNASIRRMKIIEATCQKLWQAHLHIVECPPYSLGVLSARVKTDFPDASVSMANLRYTCQQIYLFSLLVHFTIDSKRSKYTVSVIHMLLNVSMSMAIWGTDLLEVPIIHKAYARAM